MKFCRNCKYFQPNLKWLTYANQIQYGTCTHPTSITSISYHTGMIEYKEAQEMRRDRKKCGTTAKHYLDKEDIQPPKISHVVYCTNCKYQKLNTNFYDIPTQTEYAYCTHPLAIPTDLVTGFYPYAKDMRNTSDTTSENTSENTSDTTSETTHKNISETMSTCGCNGYMYEEKETLVPKITNNTDAFKRKLMAIMFTILWIILLIVL